MPNFTNYADLLERLESRNLDIRAKRCVVVRNRNASCRRCAQACASGCISLFENDLSIDVSKCIGCGTCASVCPSGAIVARGPDDPTLAKEALRALRRTRGDVVFACADVCEAADGLFDPDRVVQVACLGRIEESLLSVLFATGAHRIRLVSGACTACDHRAASTAIESVAASIETLLEAWNVDARFELSRTFPSSCKLRGDAGYDHKRREFLLALKDEAVDTAHEVVEYGIDGFFDPGGKNASRFEHVASDGMLPRCVPSRRRTLLEALSCWGEPDDVMIATRMWGHAVIDESKCSSCTMCAVFCPTGALSKYADGERLGLSHAPGLCSKCRCCEDICPAGAIRISDEVFARDMQAGVVERHPLKDVSDEKGGPDAIRNSMKKMIRTEYLYG